MKTSTIATFSLVFLLSAAAVMAAQSQTAPRPGVTPPTARVAAPAAPQPEGTSGTKIPRPAASTTSADYRIVAGDKLNIQVYKDAQLSQSLQVRPDGKITLPLVGDVRAEGRTSAELRDTLVEQLKEYNSNPVVTVIVVETVPPVFYVMGEVNAPGTLPIKGQISAVQALAMAGGFKDFAKKKDIIIQRKGPGGMTTTVPFNYNDAIKGKGTMVYVQPGDTIIVP
jgi:polysaccharide export outer membrane protein